MNAGAFVFLIPITAIICMTALKMARLRPPSGLQMLPPEVTDRLEALEHEVGTLRQELSETQERLDFTERLVSQSKSAQRLSPS